MEGYLLYMLLAVTTSLTSLYELVYPVLQRKLKETGELDNTKTYYFVFFTLNILIAPLVLPSCLIPSWGDKFRDSLYTALFSK